MERASKREREREQESATCTQDTKSPTNELINNNIKTTLLLFPGPQPTNARLYRATWIKLPECLAILNASLLPGSHYRKSASAKPVPERPHTFP